jgi:MFS family permease
VSGSRAEELGRPEPGRGHRWLVLAFVSLAMFGNYYVFDALNPVGPLLTRDLGFSKSQIGLLDTAYNVAALLVLVAGGVTVDRVGTMRAMVAFAAVTAAGGFLVAWAPGFGGMAAGRFVLGLGAEPLIVAATTVLGRWFKGKELSLAMALNLTVARLGSVAADNSASWAAPLFRSWRPPLLLAAGVGLVGVAGGLAYALVERSAARRFSLGRAGRADRLVPRDLVRFDRAYWLVVGLCVAFYSAVFPFRRFANLLFVDAHGASPEAAGFLNGLLPAMALVATPVFGFLVDRIGKRALLMAGGSLLLVPAFLMIGCTRLPLAVPVSMIGVSFSLVPAVMWPAVTYLVDERRLGTAYAVMTFCQQVGWAVTSWALGFANDAAGASAANPQGYRPGMLLLAGLGVAGLVLSALLLGVERGPGAHGLETITTQESRPDSKPVPTPVPENHRGSGQSGAS